MGGLRRGVAALGAFAVAVASVLAAPEAAPSAPTAPPAAPVDGVNLVPATPFGPLPASATTAPSGAAVAAVPSTIPVPATPADAVRAGVAVVDATWKVGASAGQYAGDRLTDGVHQLDPSALTLRREPSYGIQSRSTVRALVVEGTDGARLAIVSNDLYIPQDLLNQRVAQILRTEHAGLGIDHANLTIGVNHSHTSPYYSAIAWGVWLFQDVFDIRFFDFMAQRMADAVVAAAGSMVPVRMAAATGPFDHTQRHSFGPAIADDGTPAGYPQRDNDLTMSVLRFDDISDRSNPRPFANLVTLGQHPEFLEGNNLLSGEWVNAAQHMADVATGATTVLLQNNTGTSEPDSGGRSHAPEVRAEYSHREYAQMERGARQIANAITSISNGIGRGEPPVPDLAVPYSHDFAVAINDRQFAPPVSHPFPTVSNCRTDQVFAGNPGIPLLGLPDCNEDAGALVGPVFGTLEGTPLDPGVTYRTLLEAGLPIPDNYGAPSYTGLQETLQVHLQAIRLGDVLLTICPCEQWADQSRNIKSRADRIAGNLYLGWDWTEFCTPTGGVGADWTCPNPGAVANWDGDPSVPPAGEDGTITITDLERRRIHAQVANDAAGWDDVTSVLDAETEPLDPDRILGNYTHTELAPAHGYGLVVPVGMANDYFGYIATYREYQRGDHYRKALTGLGPHSSDWLATRLVAMGGALNGDPASAALVEPSPLDLVYAADDLVQEGRAAVLGATADLFLPLYELTLPPDLGPPAPLVQPQDITRFDVAQFTWRGGNNYSDSPVVRVERQRPDGSWETAGDMNGDVVVTIDYADDPLLGQVSYRTGTHEWRWTARFEAFSSDIDTARGHQTPTGTYRFVVDGVSRTGALLVATNKPYHVVSEPFTVGPWTGITVDDVRVEADGTVSFAVGPVATKAFDDEYPADGHDLTAVAGPIDYPDTWPAEKLPTAPETGRVLFPRLERTLIAGSQQYCFSCTFRPWADVGTVASATVEVTQASGAVETVAATLRADGRWATAATLGPGDTARVARGGVVDTFGEINGSASPVVVAGGGSAPGGPGSGGPGGGLPATGGGAAPLPMLLATAVLVAALVVRRRTVPHP